MVVDCKEEVLVVDNNQLPFLCPYHLFFSRHPNHQGKKEIHHLLKPKNVVSAEQTLIMVSPEMSISLCALLDVFICVYVCGGQGTCPNTGPHQLSHGARKALSMLLGLLTSGPATKAAVLM